MDVDLYGVTITLCWNVSSIPFDSVQHVETYARERGGPELTPETRAIVTTILSREAFATLVRTPMKHHTRAMYDAVLAGIEATPENIRQLAEMNEALALVLVPYLADDEPAEIKGTAILKG